MYQDQRIYQTIVSKKKGKGKQRRSCDSSNSDSSSDNESWRSGLSGDEQIHIHVSAKINPSEDNIEFEDNNIKGYRKKAKKWSKKQRQQESLAPSPVRRVPHTATSMIIGTFNGILYPIKSK